MNINSYTKTEVHASNVRAYLNTMNYDEFEAELNGRSYLIRRINGKDQIYRDKKRVTLKELQNDYRETRKLIG